MKKISSKVPILLLVVGLLLTGCQPIVAPPDMATAPTTASSGERPNILLILIDDMGYSDVGPFGSEIATPAIDTLASTGVKITDFHTAASCSPTRAMLMTGVDNHQTGYGNMSESLLPEQIGQPGYEGHLNDRVVTVAQLLNESGYHTYMTGKWHLGREANEPHGRGFEQSFAVLQGFSGHMTLTPAFEGSQTTYTHNGEVVEMPADFGYSTDYYTDRMIEFIDSNKSTDQPFFGYLSYTAAHDPLQAPAEWIEKQHGRYDAGYEALRAERVARMKELGIIPQETESAPFFEEHAPSWDSLSPEEQAIQSREMEVYAAMIANMDYNVARLFDYLREIGEYENTVIFFLSDNGANWEEIDMWGAEWINATYDNSLENIGAANSFAMYGTGWAQASMGPFHLFKGFAAEGGIRAPLIISGPGVKRVGETSHAFAHVTDLMPTMLELAGATYPDTFNGNELAPLYGESMVPFLTGGQETIHPADRVTGWEVWGRAALRKGNWKLLWVEEPFGNSQWALYDLTTDLAEQHDLAAEKPEIVADLMAEWEKYVEENGLILALGKGAAE